MKKNIEFLLILLLGFFYILISCYFFGKSCPFQILFGFSCPACGMTRAIQSALCFDFKSAFYYHPLFWFSPIFFVILDWTVKGKNKKYLIYITTITVILFLMVYFIRIFLDSDVLIFDYTNGILYQFFHTIIKNN